MGRRLDCEPEMSLFMKRKWELTRASAFCVFDDAMMKEEITVASVVKFFTIVTLQKANGKGEVCINIALKIYKERVNIRFRANGKGPYKVGIVI